MDMEEEESDVFLPKRSMWFLKSLVNARFKGLLTAGRIHLQKFHNLKSSHEDPLDEIRKMHDRSSLKQTSANDYLYQILSYSSYPLKLIFFFPILIVLISYWSCFSTSRLRLVK